jgi:single-stranded DNA-specific DHH superfamily exonuclease
VAGEVDRYVNEISRAALRSKTFDIISYGVLKMSDPIQIESAIAKKIYARLENALYIIEAIDENVIEHDLIEVAAAVYQAQQTIISLVLTRQPISPEWPSPDDD